MGKLKKGQKLACVPCGREVTVDCCGLAQKTIWCCGKPMARRASKSKKTVKK